MLYFVKDDSFVFPIKSAMKSAKSALALVLVFGACATPPVPPPAEQPPVQREEIQSVGSEAFQSLERAVAAAYEREQAMAERVRQLETSNAQLRQALRALQSQSRVLSARLDSFPRRAQSPRPTATSDSGKSDAFNMYQGALYYYRHKQYDRALAEFDRLLREAPMSEWSDNAQYWKGECYYGLRQYQQALIEFTKVFAFSNTDKADDSQLKIARCHLALDERDRALAALRKLVDEYPDSEYVPTAREQIKHLGG